MIDRKIHFTKIAIDLGGGDCVPVCRPCILENNPKKNAGGESFYRNFLHESSVSVHEVTSNSISRFFQKCPRNISDTEGPFFKKTSFFEARLQILLNYFKLNGGGVLVTCLALGPFFKKT